MPWKLLEASQMPNVGPDKSINLMSLPSMGGRLIYLDALRVIAAFAVVVVHVVSRSWYTVDVDSAQWFWLNLFDSMARWCVPLFVMISGALFLRPEKPVSIDSLMHRSVLRLIVAFVTTSLLYALWDLALGRIDSPGEFVRQLVSGRNHLWFLYMLAGLYIITPFARRIAEDRNLLRYFLVLSSVLTFAVPTLLHYLNASPLFTDIPCINLLSSSLEIVYEKLNFTFTIGYISYYFLGYYLSTTELSRVVRFLLYGLGFSSLIFTVSFTLLVSRLNSAPYEGAYDYMTLNVALMSCSLFIFMRYSMNRIGISRRGTSRLQSLSDLTFVLYLVHQFVLDCTVDLYLGVQFVSIEPLLFVPLCSFAGFALSLLISAAFSKILSQTKLVVLAIWKGSNGL